MRSSVSSEPPSRRRRMPQSSLFFRPALIVSALLLGAGIALRDVPSAAESARSVPPPVLDTPANPEATSEVAILAGACFWGVQGVFQHVNGVTSALSGYAGGAADTAHYEMVGTNTTGHAESVTLGEKCPQSAVSAILAADVAEPVLRPSLTITGGRHGYPDFALLFAMRVND